AHREVIRDGETGYFFKAGDVEDLARTLLSALEGRERRERVARAARDFVEDRYTWRSVAIRMDRIYDDCRGERSVFPDHSHSSGDH
ncbi:MAG: glycosyltransferase, partial [Nitrospirota bacterium]